MVKYVKNKQGIWVHPDTIVKVKTKKKDNIIKQIIKKITPKETQTKEPPIYLNNKNLIKNDTRDNRSNNRIYLNRSTSKLSNKKIQEKNIIKKVVDAQKKVFEIEKRIGKGILQAPLSIAKGTGKLSFYYIDNVGRLTNIAYAKIIYKDAKKGLSTPVISDIILSNKGREILGYNRKGEKMWYDPDVQGVYIAGASMGIGSVSSTAGKWIGRGFVGYGIKETIKEPTPENIGQTIFLGYAGKTTKDIRKATGGENPRIIRSYDFPKAGRKDTLKRLEPYIGKKIPSITGKGAGKEFYIGEPKYAKAKKAKGYFSNPLSSIQLGKPVYRYGDFALDPYRNPKYWLKNIKDIKIIKTKKGNTLSLPEPNPLKWTTKNEELLISKNPYKPVKKLKDIQKIAKKEPTSTTPPKTIRKYSQPEEELFNVMTGKRLNKRKVYIGRDPTGIPIYEEISANKSKVKHKIKQRFENLKETLFQKNEIYERDVAYRSKRKYNLIKKGNIEGNLIDNSGINHINRIKRIGRKLGVKNQNMLDAFAYVHDINKEKTFNYKTYKVISEGIKKGYYDFIPQIKRMSTKEKEYLAHLVRYDERPPWNLTNVRKRFPEMIEFGISTLDNEGKKIINADRLARFGNKADPNMIFKTNESPTIKEITKDIKEKSEKISKKEIELQKQIDKFNKEYREKYNKYEQNEYKTPYKDSYKRNPYIKRQYNSNKYSPHTEPLTYIQPPYSPDQKPPYIQPPYSPDQKPPYIQPPYSPDPEPPPYIQPPYSPDPEPPPYIQPPYDTTTKKKTETKKGYNLKEENKRLVEGYIPIIKKKNGKIIKGQVFASITQAIAEGEIMLEENPYGNMNIERVFVPFNEIRQSQRARFLNQKYLNKGNTYYNQQLNANIKKKSNNYNWMKQLKQYKLPIYQ